MANIENKLITVEGLQTVLDNKSSNTNWESITDKPFKTIGKNLSVSEDEVLNVTLPTFSINEEGHLIAIWDD